MEINIVKKRIPTDAEILEATRILVEASHGRAWNAGWYHDLKTGQVTTRSIPEVIALMHSELSEALEGHRKNLMDDKLPHRKMVPVELFDCVIRIMDTIGAMYYDDIPALLEKMKYNDKRADHKFENRIKEGGKKI